MHKAQILAAEFNLAFGLPVGRTPEINDPEFRCKLIAEECQETIDAIREGNLLQTIDGLGDLVYVCYSTAVAIGVDLDPYYDEIHRANMRKSLERDSEGKASKPEGWIPPNHAPIVARQERDGIFYPRYAALGPNRSYRPAAISALAQAIDEERLAKLLRETWAAYAEATLTKPPAAFTKSWEETGDWGREGNRIVVRALVQDIMETIARSGF